LARLGTKRCSAAEQLAVFPILLNNRAAVAERILGRRKNRCAKVFDGVGDLTVFRFTDACEVGLQVGSTEPSIGAAKAFAATRFLASRIAVVNCRGFKRLALSFFLIALFNAIGFIEGASGTVPCVAVAEVTEFSILARAGGKALSFTVRTALRAEQDVRRAGGFASVVKFTAFPTSSVALAIANRGLIAGTVVKALADAGTDAKVDHVLQIALDLF
jgi:hypothetical protein